MKIYHTKAIKYLPLRIVEWEKGVIMMNCKDCIWQQSCEEKGKPCAQHTTIVQRMNSLHLTKEEYEAFSEDWDKARYRIRRKCGIKERRYV